MSGPWVAMRGKTETWEVDQEWVTPFGQLDLAVSVIITLWSFFITICLINSVFKTWVLTQPLQSVCFKLFGLSNTGEKLSEPSRENSVIIYIDLNVSFAWTYYHFYFSHSFLLLFWSAVWLFALPTQIQLSSEISLAII